MANHELSRALESAKETIEERNKRNLEERRKEEQAETEYRAFENKKLDEKIRLSRDVFGWAEKFVASAEYREIQKIKKSGEFGFLTGSDKDKLWIYSGAWGHDRGDGYGRWSRFCVRPDATFHYYAGYKWMPTGPDIDFNSVDELASRLNHRYLSRLHDFLMSGRVYGELAKNIKESAERWF